MRIALSLPSRTKSEQVRPSQGRPGEARAVGFWCKLKCKNMLPMLQFIYLFFFIFLLFFLLLLLPGLLCLVEHKNVQATRRGTHWTFGLRVHIVYFTHLLARRRYCAVPPSGPSSGSLFPIPSYDFSSHCIHSSSSSTARQAASNWLVLSCRTFSS